MNIGSSLDSAISTLQRNVDNAKSVAAQIANEDDASNSSNDTKVKSGSDTVGQMVDVKA